MKKNHWILFFLMAFIFEGHAAQITHTSQAEFDSVNDGGTSHNVSTAGDELSLATVDEKAGDYYRESASFDQTEFWIQLDKDSDLSPVFFAEAHPCIDKSDVISFYDDDTYYTIDAGRHRIGPENGIGPPEAVVYSNLELLTIAWIAYSDNRASQLRFITSGTHAETSLRPEEYFVEITYLGAPNELIQIPIPLDSESPNAPGSVLDSSDGNAVCNLEGSDDWCILETGDAVGTGGISCDDDNDDLGHLWEVAIALNDSSQVFSIKISYNLFDSVAPGLGGPIAVSMVVDEPTYENLFNYKGEFVTETAVIDAGDTALWWQLDYTQTDREGEIRVEFDCNQVVGGYTGLNWNDGGPWPYQFSNSNPSSPENTAFEISSDFAGGANPGDHCQGQFATYTVHLLSELDPSQAPTFQDITLTYAIDADADGYGVGAHLPPHQAGQPDECDQNPSVTGTAPYWYADCDGDGALQATADIQACSMAEALQDITECAGNANGDMPFNVSDTAPATPDCNDADAMGAIFENWYPDCDDDDVHAMSATNACGISGANDLFDCANGMDPPGSGADQWVTTPGTDCDDENSAAANANMPWYADCDGDVAFQATGDILACTMSDALADDMECAGNDNGDLPFDVSATPPLEPDCDDFDANAQVLDCSGVCGGDDVSCLPFFSDGFELAWIFLPACPSASHPDRTEQL